MLEVSLPKLAFRFLLSVAIMFGLSFQNLLAVTSSLSMEDDISTKSQAGDLLTLRKQSVYIPSSTNSEVTLSWHNPGDVIVLGLTSPASYETLRQLSYLGLDASHVAIQQTSNGFIYFCKLTSVTDNGSAPLPILPEQLILNASTLATTSGSRVLYHDVLKNCDTASIAKPGLTLIAGNAEFHWSVEGILTCGGAGSKESKSKEGKGKGTKKEAANDPSSNGGEGEGEAPPPGGEGSDSGNGGGGDDGRDKRDPTATGTGAADDLDDEDDANMPPLENQLTDISASGLAINMAATELGEIGEVPPGLVSWSQSHLAASPVDPNSSHLSQWTTLLTGLTSGSASDLLANIPEDLLEQFKKITQKAWKAHCKPSAESLGSPADKPLEEEMEKLRLDETASEKQ